MLQDFLPIICKNGVTASVLQSCAEELTSYSTQSLLQDRILLPYFHTLTSEIPATIYAFSSKPAGSKLPPPLPPGVSFPMGRKLFLLLLPLPSLYQLLLTDKIQTLLLY